MQRPGGYTSSTVGVHDLRAVCCAPKCAGRCSRWRWHKGECRPLLALARPLLALALAPARQRSRRLTRCACWRYYSGQGGGSRRADFHAELCFVCLLHPRHRVLFAERLFQGHRVRHGAPENGNGGGRPVGRGRARRTGTSATRIFRGGNIPRPSITTRRTWRLQRRWATGRGRARRTQTSATRMSRR